VWNLTQSYESSLGNKFNFTGINRILLKAFAEAKLDGNLQGVKLVLGCVII
jgi:hypothetical protein